MHSKPQWHRLGQSTRTVLAALLSVMCVACARKEIHQVNQASQANKESPAATAPKYVTEAQRARAQYYWLPRNQLLPDAGVEYPTPGNTPTSVPIRLPIKQR